MSVDADEVRRIREAYGGRTGKISSGYYSIFTGGNLFLMHARERAVIGTLKQNGITSLQDKKILDIGCGNGRELRNFLRYGASPGNLFGVDLLEDRIKAARELSPNINFRCSDATRLDFREGTFDIVLLFTVFTSILDADMRSSVAREALRVLKPGGSVVWFDCRTDNPKNPDVRGMRRAEITELFSGCEISLNAVIPAPPLTRALVRYSWLACHLIEKLKFLNTHYAGIIRKPK